jgi:hypothetical protein
MDIHELDQCIAKAKAEQSRTKRQLESVEKAIAETQRQGKLISQLSGD